MRARRRVRGGRGRGGALGSALDRPLRERAPRGEDAPVPEGQPLPRHDGDLPQGGPEPQPQAHAAGEPQGRVRLRPDDVGVPERARVLPPLPQSQSRARVHRQAHRRRHGPRHLPRRIRDRDRPQARPARGHPEVRVQPAAHRRVQVRPARVRAGRARGPARRIRLRRGHRAPGDDGVRRPRRGKPEGEDDAPHQLQRQQAQRGVRARGRGRRGDEARDVGAVPRPGEERARRRETEGTNRRRRRAHRRVHPAAPRARVPQRGDQRTEERRGEAAGAGGGEEGDFVFVVGEEGGVAGGGRVRRPVRRSGRGRRRYRR